MRASNILGLVFFVGVWACGGDAASPDYVEPFGSLKGEVTAATPVQGQNVRIALAWYRVVGGDPLTAYEGAHAVMETQDVPVSSTFPASFTVDITELPPAETMQSFSPSDTQRWGLAESNAYAVGVLLVYEDQNGNGKLDFTPGTASAIVDKLLGHAGGDDGQIVHSYEVVFWQGPAPTANVWDGYSPGIVPGFNLRRTEWAPGSGVDSTAVAATGTVVPLDTPLSIALSGDLRRSCYLVEPMPRLLPDGPDRPITPQLFGCVDNQPYADSSALCLNPFPVYVSSRTVQQSSAIEQLCGPAVEECAVYADPHAADPMDLGLALPPDWPCATP